MYLVSYLMCSDSGISGCGNESTDDLENWLLEKRRSPEMSEKIIIITNVVKVTENFSELYAKLTNNKKGE